MSRRIPPAECGYESPDESQIRGPGSTPESPISRHVLEPETAVPRRPQLTGPSSLSVMVTRAHFSGPQGKVGLRDRIGCYRWTWFTMTMATGGIANVLYSVPFRSRWLTVVGTIFYLFNIVLFLLNSILITLRFRLHRGSFVASFRNQVESLFVPAFVVSIAVILINTCQYGIPKAGCWLQTTLESLFWVYMGLSVFASAGMYLLLWSTQVFPLHTMTPVWVFPAYPLLLAAPFAGTLINVTIASGRGITTNTMAVALCAVAVQATGFLISFMICAAFIYRLMTQKLPRDDQRPGVFISIGPSGFTVAGIVLLGSQAEEIFPPNFLGVGNSPSIFKLLAYVTGLCLWGMCIWFLLVSVGSLWKYLKTPSKFNFQMTWFSFVFPNTAMVTATIQLGRAFDSQTLQIFGCVLAGCIVVVWALVFASMLRCLRRRELLWPKEPKSEA